MLVTYTDKHKKVSFLFVTDFVATEFGASKVQNSTREIGIVEGTQETHGSREAKESEVRINRRLGRYKCY